VTVPNVESSVRSRTLERPPVALERTNAAPVTPSPTQIERLAATNATSAKGSLIAALDRAAQGEMGDPAAHNATAVLIATTLAGLPAEVTPRTFRRGRRVQAIAARVHRSARLDREATRATTRTRVIADRVCPRVIAHPVARVSNAPGS
jgi:hypothetical protein